MIGLFWQIVSPLELNWVLTDPGPDVHVTESPLEQIRDQFWG